jgi:hypothetical protein
MFYCLVMDAFVLEIYALLCFGNASSEASSRLAGCRCLFLPSDCAVSLYAQKVQPFKERRLTSKLPIEFEWLLREPLPSVDFCLFVIHVITDKVQTSPAAGSLLA